MLGTALGRTSDEDLASKICKCADPEQMISSSYVLGKVNSIIFDIWSEIIAYDEIMGWIHSDTDNALQIIVRDVDHETFGIMAGKSVKMSIWTL